MSIVLEPIGIIRTPHQAEAGTPVQPVMAQNVDGTLELNREFAEGLVDLDGFDRIWVLFHCDRTRPARMSVTPYLDDQPHGIFATRSPGRPNPIGLSSVEVLAVEGNCIHVRGVDMLDRSPLLDIKPYVPRFDLFPAERWGWYESCEGFHRSDSTAVDRFTK